MSFSRHPRDRHRRRQGARGLQPGHRGGPADHGRDPGPLRARLRAPPRRAAAPLRRHGDAGRGVPRALCAAGGGDRRAPCASSAGSSSRAVIGSVLGGYVALASFLVDQAVWISILLALLLLSIALADEFIGGTLRGQTPDRHDPSGQYGPAPPLPRADRRAGQRRGARCASSSSAILLALAPWGIESTDLMGSLRAAFFGFKVGDVTISLSAIVIAALLFALGFSRHAGGAALARHHLPAGHRPRCGPAQLDPHGGRLCRHHRGRRASPSPISA